MLSVCPAYPSPFPHLLLSASTSGTPQLTDLRSPDSDTLPGKSSRLANKNVVYSPHLRSYIMTSEDDGILAYPIRRFFHGITIARYSGQGSLTALATSRWHPCLLWGTASGTVSATNLARRILPAVKQTGGIGSGAWVQKLCEHHWVPTSPPSGSNTEAEADAIQSSVQNGVPPNPPSTTAGKTFHPPATRPGTTRFHDAFRPEKQDLSSQGKMQARGLAAKTGMETIFEEEQAVTAAEWNPNLDCAGWVAVGWASGIVRVEDCAHDAT